METDSSIISDYKLKQCPVDTWTTREQLCLNSAVLQTGDQNWVAVSRAIRQLTVETDRPPDWYSTKNCALQYAKLLEHVDPPKRKREKTEGMQNETPGEIVTKMLSRSMLSCLERVEELKGILEEEKATYNQLKKEIIHLESNQLDNRLHQYWDEMIREQEQEEEEAEKFKAFYQEREEKIRNFRAAAKLQSIKAQTASTPKKNLTPAKPQGTQGIKTSGSAETPSADLSGAEKEMETDPRLSENNQSEVTDDNEPSGHESPTKSACEETLGEEEHIEDTFPVEVKEEEALKSSEDVIEELKCDTSFETNIPLDYTSNLNDELKDHDHEICPEEEKKMTDASDVNDSKNAELKIKEEEEEEELLKEQHDEGEMSDSQLEFQSEEERAGDEITFREKIVCKENNETNDEEMGGEEEVENEDEEEKLTDKEDEWKEKEGMKMGRKKRIQLLGVSKDESKGLKQDDNTEGALKKETDDRDLDAEKKKVPFPSAPDPSTSLLDDDLAKRTFPKKDEYEFEDDGSRESTDVKDYMCRGDRRKFSMGDSASSPVVSESTPSSPASTNYGDDPEAEKSHRSWKRSIMLIWNDIAAHKNASIFLKPITDDKVPGYRSIVYRPVDLMSIKRNIESGMIRTTTDFQRDVMLMFLNAKMYNTRDHNVYRMAEHMMNDAVETIEEFIHAQMLARAVESPQKNLRRETRESSAKRGEDKRKREDKDDKNAKRRKV